MCVLLNNINSSYEVLLTKIPVLKLTGKVTNTIRIILAYCMWAGIVWRDTRDQSDITSYNATY